MAQSSHWIFLLSVYPLFSSIAALKDQKNITAESGQNVALTCRAPNNIKPIIVVEWSRADLGTEHVLLYRDEQFDPEQQHPSFKDRVDLQDRQMKDGDVSLILKNVTINDTGTYECRVVQRETNHSMRAHLKTEPICIIYLRVAPPPPGPGGGPEEDATGRLRVGLLVSVVLLVAAAVGFLIYRKYNEQQTQDPQRPAPTEPV